MPYETFVYDLISYLHSFRMLRQRHRVVVDESHLDVADHQQVHRQCPVHLIYKENLLVRHQCVVENPHLLMLHLMQDVLHLDVLQILGEQNLDVIPPFQGAELQFPQVAVVDAEPRYLLKMDCYLDEAQVLMERQVLRRQLHGRRRDRLPHALQLPLY